MKTEIVSHDGSIACSHCDEPHSPLIRYTRIPIPWGEEHVDDDKNFYVCLSCIADLASYREDDHARRQNRTEEQHE